jgi:hypothetical protein
MALRFAAEWKRLKLLGDATGFLGQPDFGLLAKYFT